MVRWGSTRPGWVALRQGSAAAVSSRGVGRRACWSPSRSGEEPRGASAWPSSLTSKRPPSTTSSRRTWLRERPIYTDGLKSFGGLEEVGCKSVPRTQPLRSALRKGAKSVVPLADRAIGNLQQWLVGTHHGVSRGQFQVYLDEFVFRHNRRRQPMAAFQTLLGLGTTHRPTPYQRIRGAQDVEVRLG